ncbi:hypothetical protein SAMN05444392_101233 [Seinonella peptonophila]|uniref:DUF4870 domain-containing protein n=1 Tax=Seinonella peptonophila TaxID=112248 RepID=A0A1M4T003_9BACL|nr:DUF4870 domain-containing protein [Seinonella peptonophila]SHE37756.1 hypothetical protein SAMN05444392_101233 [Seinonella peptonophila]
MNIDPRGWKVLVHASTWFAPFIVPILVYAFIRDREVRSISIQAFVFHLAMSILISISIFFSIILIGIPFLLFFGLVGFIVPLIGILYAIRDMPFHYPLLGSIVEK